MKTDGFIHLIRQRFFEHEKLFDAIIHKNPLSNQKSIST
jgi:hypothetical protein